MPRVSKTTWSVFWSTMPFQHVGYWEKFLKRKLLIIQQSKDLKEQRIGGPVYYIVSGINPYEGMVIERDVNAVHAYYELSEENWFIVQTNYDRDYPDPLHDPRRVPVEKRMRERGNVGLN